LWLDKFGEAAKLNILINNLFVDVVLITKGLNTYEKDF